MTSTKSDKSDGPKTALDEKFLAIAAQVMMSHGIKSDRGISAALGKHPDFINRIRRGLQSAPPDAWDALFDKYPEARSITTNNVMSQGSGQAIGTNHGTANYDLDQPVLKPKEEANQPDIIIQLENAKVLLVEVKRYAAQLESQLADKERIIKLLEQSLNKSS